MALDQTELIRKARTSPFYLWLLNQSLDHLIPFNKPHKIRIVQLDEEGIKTSIPYRKRNLNHIKGLHACALATLSEFTTGFLLISRLNMKDYRLIMKRIEMEYHYQGKTDVVAEFSISHQQLQGSIVDPLRTQDAVLVPCEVKTHDQKGNHVATGHVEWQVKQWSKVKTRT